MKSLFEHMLSIVIIVFMVYLFAGISSLEMQTLNARIYHAELIENIQDSHYRCILDSNGEISYAGIEIPEGYHLNISQIGESHYTRRSFLVCLEYPLVLPLFGYSGQGSLSGYAR